MKKFLTSASFVTLLIAGSLSAAGAQTAATTVVSSATLTCGADLACTSVTTNGNWVGTAQLDAATAAKIAAAITSVNVDGTTIVGNGNTIPLSIAPAVMTSITNAQTTANGAVTTANAALALAQNSVQYDNTGKTSVTLNPGGAVATLTNLAAGSLSATSTDAVNGAQLFTTNNNLTNLTNQIVNGTIGLVQQNGGSNAPITVGAATGGTSVNITGTAGNRVLTGVANGVVSMTSADAINGSQLFAAVTNANTIGNGSAAGLGGGATWNAATGTWTAPSYTVGGTAYDNVGSALGAIQTKGDTTGSTTAAALGGGSTYDPATGTVSAPKILIGGVTYNNVTNAFAAQNKLAVQYVPDANGNPTNKVVLTGNGNGAPVALTNVANGALNATSLDAVNGGQLYAVSQGAVKYDTNPDGSTNYASVTFNPGGAAATLHNVAAGTARTDAANVGQLNDVASWANNQFANMNAGLDALKKEARSGIAGSNALAALNFTADKGKVVAVAGWGGFRGYSAFAAGATARSEGGEVYLRAGVSIVPTAPKNLGGNIGAGWQIN